MWFQADWQAETTLSWLSTGRSNVLEYSRHKIDQ